MKKILLFTFITVLSSTYLHAKDITNAITYVDAIDTLETEIFIPNVFSPNGDGLNDLFKAKGNFSKLSVKIYNRHGALLYNSIQLNEGWNGRTSSGTKCSQGTYFYIIETSSQKFTGALTLLR